MISTLPLDLQVTGRPEPLSARERTVQQVARAERVQALGEFAPERADTSRPSETERLVDAVRDEVQIHHESILEMLAAEIEEGLYQPDFEVLAERVALAAELE